MEALVAAHPRAARYLADEPKAATLRIILNGSVVDVGDDPLVHGDDSLLLIQAVAGGLHGW